MNLTNVSHVTYTEVMKRLSIRELHSTTGKIVRRTRWETFLITDNGQAVAVLKAAGPADTGGTPFPKGHWRRHPPIASKGDSTRAVSDDRNRF